METNNVNTLIIAEAGVNHNGDMDMARELINVAANAGADIVKFQTFTADGVVTTDARKANYQIQTTDAIESQYDMLHHLELTREMHEELIAHCKIRGIQFFSTGFDLNSVDMLGELGQTAYKIPSGEITNLPYLRHVGSYGKQTIISTGMSTIDEIKNALEVLEVAGTKRELITVLHCTSEYPTPMADVNLKAMLAIKEKFGVNVGYSDHTNGIEVAIAAVALGASVIEKHFTLDKTLPGPDHTASLEPNDLKSMVEAIRNIEKALGDGNKRPSSSEMKNIKIIRRSIVAARAIKKGEIFNEKNLTTKRPGTGVSPMRWDEVLGLKASRSFVQDELIEL